MRNLALLASVFLATACTADVASFEDQSATEGASITITPDLAGCHGKASTSIPASGDYVLTTFGGGADTQPMSCGGTANGTGWYAASRQRYGCGAHLKVTANNKCVVVSAMDYGPDVCVETAAHSPVLDMSPAVSKYLFNESGAGWSDHLVINVEEVSTGTPVGPCQAEPPPAGGSDSGSGSGDPGGGTSTGASCASTTLDRDVDDGTCVQSASDANMYKCENGAWVASSSGCAETYAYCDSATLGRAVPARTCVQSGATGTWFQCNGQTWVGPVSTADRSGPIGTCSSWNAR